MPIPQIHNVNVVYQQNRQENIRHMLDLVANLEMVTNQVFGRIMKRVQDSKIQLQSLQKRQQRCQRMVEAVAGRTVVTTILSPPIYPGYTKKQDQEKSSNRPSMAVKEHDVLDSNPVFDRSEERRKVEGNEARIHRIKSDMAEVKKFVLSDPMTYFQRRFENQTFRQQMIEKEISKKPISSLAEEVDAKRPPRYGLGEYPPKMDSVSGLLLFNSNADVYFAYQDDIDPTRGDEHDDEDEEEVAKTGIDPPPESLVKGDDMPAFSVQSLSFRPTMKPLRKFGIPQQLDLPNVANTGEWAVADLESIAPSELIKQQTFSAAPPTAADSDLPLAQGPPSGLAPPDGLAPPSGLAPPDGLAPPSGLAPPDGLAPPSLAPPGLAPPGEGGLQPPAGLEVPTQGLVPPGKLKTKVVKDQPKPQSGRAAMLDAIRNFRKSNLKTNKAKKKKKNNQKKEAAPPQGGHMAELFGKIMMRRKAIAGSKNNADDGDDDDDDAPGGMQGERIGMPDEIPKQTLQQKMAEEEDAMEDENKDDEWSDGSSF